MRFHHDLRFAFRSFTKAPAFAVTAVLTLALGMGLWTTAIGVLKAYVVEELPYPAATRLFWISYGQPGQAEPQEMENLDWSALDDVIEQPIAWDLDMFYVLGNDHAEPTPGAWVTPGFVDGLGIRPEFGRGLDATAFKPGAPTVALISHRLWTTRFGSDPAVLGRSFTAYVSDRPEEAERFTIVGVLPASFWHVNPYTDILAPLRAPTYPYMARLRAGVTPQQAADRIGELVRGGARAVPPNWSPHVVSLHEEYVRRMRPILRAVTVAATLVLMVACGNIAGLLLVRAIARQKEVAVRTALGGGRAAIARMLIAEGLLLGAAASGIGILAARTALVPLAPLIQQQLGRSAPGGAAAFALDPRTLAIAIGVGMATALLCSLAPLGTLFTGSLSTTLQAGPRGGTDAPRNRRMRSALIAVEIAASFTLIVGSTLMIRTVAAMLHTDLGFAADHVVMTSVTLRQNRYPTDGSRTAAFERIAGEIASLPGADSVALTTAWPVQQQRLQPIGLSSSSGAPTTQAAVQRIDDHYFSTVGIPIVAGRHFTGADQSTSEPVVIVSESLARRLAPASGLPGSYVLIPQETDSGPPTPVVRRIVGIARDVRQTPADTDLADAYVPFMQSPGRFAFVLVRVREGASNWATSVGEVIRRIDPEIALQPPRRLDAAVDELVARPRFFASLLTAFAVIASTLALVGIYSVISFAVRRREREIAVRMALGADAAALTRFFVRQGGAVLAIGIALGVLGALAGGRLIESQLYSVTARDPVAIMASVIAFAGAGLLAIWWPSRRAAAMDPAIALRAE